MKREQREEVVAMLKQGKKQLHIARQFNILPVRVSEIALQEGLSPRFNSWATQNRIKMVVDYLSGQYRTSHICSSYGVSRESLAVATSLLRNSKAIELYKKNNTGCCLQDGKVKVMKEMLIDNMVITTGPVINGIYEVKIDGFGVIMMDVENNYIQSITLFEGSELGIWEGGAFFWFDWLNFLADKMKVEVDDLYYTFAWDYSIHKDINFY